MCYKIVLSNDEVIAVSTITTPNNGRLKTMVNVSERYGKDYWLTIAINNKLAVEFADNDKIVWLTIPVASIKQMITF